MDIGSLVLVLVLVPVFSFPSDFYTFFSFFIALRYGSKKENQINIKYNTSVQLFESGRYQEAILYNIILLM